MLKFLVPAILLLACTSLHARIGLRMDDLKNNLQKVGGIALQQGINEAADLHHINKHRCRIDLNDKGQWLIEATSWASTGIVHVMKYTKQDGFIPGDMIDQIIAGNRGNRENLAVWDPVFEPNKAKPVTITIRSKQLDELLKFKEQWSVMGLTLKQLEQRFGAGKLENPGQEPPKYLYQEFDPAHNINWSITVDLWQGIHDKEPVVHQVYYERKTKFSFQELTWLREINSKGWEWEAAGAKSPWLKYKTVVPNVLGKKPDLGARPELRAGVKHMDHQFEAPLIAIYSLNFHLRPPDIDPAKKPDEKADEPEKLVLPFLK